MTERNGLWGNMPPSEEINEDLADLVIQNTLRQPQFGSNAYKAHNTEEEQESEKVLLPPECSAMEETVLHTIRLLQYAKKMQMIIDKLKAKEDPKDLTLQPPVFPEQPDRKPLHRMVFPFRYMERVATPFVEGLGDFCPELTEDSARLILRKCVATIFAHIGYDDTTQDVLDIMTDISEEYIGKLTSLLRVACDHELLSGNVGFPDVMERVFHEIGIGSVLNLHTFYQTRVISYHHKTMVRCRKLAAEYANLTAPVIKQEVVGEVVKCKIENEEVEEYVDVPEIHFPALEDGCSTDDIQPSLEPGFQMLQNLEQEEQWLRETDAAKRDLYDMNSHSMSFDE